MGLAIIIPEVDFSDANLGKVSLSVNIPVMSLSIVSPISIVGKNYKLAISFSPINTNQRGVVWSVTSGSEYASVASDGVLTIKKGANKSPVIVKVVSTADSTISATKQINVTYANSDTPEVEIPFQYTLSTGVISVASGEPEIDNNQVGYVSTIIDNKKGELVAVSCSNDVYFEFVYFGNKNLNVSRGINISNFNFIEDAKVGIVFRRGTRWNDPLNLDIDYANENIKITKGVITKQFFAGYYDAVGYKYMDSLKRVSTAFISIPEGKKLRVRCTDCYLRAIAEKLPDGTVKPNYPDYISNLNVTEYEFEGNPSNSYSLTFSGSIDGNTALPSLEPNNISIEIV